MIRITEETEKIVVPVNGRNIFISGQELTKIVAQYYKENAPHTKLASNPKKNDHPKDISKNFNSFMVYPGKISVKNFQQKRKDPRQEKTRKIILKALAKVKRYPQKYGRPFRIIIPEENRPTYTLEEMYKIVSEYGHHMTTWVEQALEWAQRIQNGASWESICNTADTNQNRRAVIWKRGKIRLIGGYIGGTPHYVFPASYVGLKVKIPYLILLYTVPSIVYYP